MKKKLANVLTYQTPRIVRVIDRKIGMIYYGLCALLISYSVFYVLIYKQMSFMREKTNGVSALKPYGRFIGVTSKGEQRVFDTGDIVRDQGETNGLFIATRIDITAGQQQELLKCLSQTSNIIQTYQQCELKCLNSGYCKQFSWCPVNLDPKSTKSFSIQNITTGLTFDFYNVIQFGLENVEEEEDKLYATYKHPGETIFYPQPYSNAFNLSSLIDPSLYQSVMANGSLVKILFDYNCNVEERYCDPIITLTQLSRQGEQLPVYYEKSIPYTINGEENRDYYRYTGIRIIVQVNGEGKSYVCNFKTLSIPAIILQLSSLMALLRIAAVISDFLMLNLPMLPLEHRKLYFGYKCENSDDFSSLQQKINVVDREQAKRLKKIKRGEIGAAGEALGGENSSILGSDYQGMHRRRGGGSNESSNN